VQDFEYAMFFMTDSVMAYFDQSDGFEVGVGSSVVVMDQGTAKTLTTTTAQSDVYAFIFRQEGLMAGLGVQGSKITRINPQRAPTGPDRRAGSRRANCVPHGARSPGQDDNRVGARAPTPQGGRQCDEDW
jgi:hypothetical protein